MDRERRVVVAMSGGVDSSVTAAVLKERGYEVIGVTLQLFVDGRNACSGEDGCTTTKDSRDAAQVAKKIGIEHHILNREEMFRKDVIEPFVADYIKGITPVPCARCDRRVKMRELINFAKSINAGYVASGHYARIIDGPNGKEIHMASHAHRDQTYFLYGLLQEDIDYLMFPLGEMHKSDVRNIAGKFGLHVEKKKDSQDICFVRDKDYISVIQSIKPIEMQTGSIIHIETKEKLGEHNGLLNYTIGQRRGIGIANSTPLYVISTDKKANILYVGDESHLYSSAFIVDNVNIFDKKMLSDKKINIDVCVRALQSPISAEVSIISPRNGSTAKELDDDGESLLHGYVNLKKAARAITAGQICAFYSGTRLLGGGIIRCIASEC